MQMIKFNIKLLLHRVNALFGFNSFLWEIYDSIKLEELTVNVKQSRGVRR